MIHLEKQSVKVMARNREAYHEYFVEEEMEAGIELCGTEVKSIRQGTLNLKDAWCGIKNGEMLLAIMLAKHGLKLLCHLIGIAKEGINVRSFLWSDFSKGFLLQEFELLNHHLVHLKIFGTIFTLVEEGVAPHALKGEQARHLETGIFQNALSSAEQFRVESAHRGADNQIGIFRFHQVAQECDGVSGKHGKIRSNYLYAMRIQHLAQHHYRAG